MNDKFTGLLGDPMLQIGLGILANNTGNRGAFAPAFGRGVMQGMNNAQDFAQQQQMLGLRQDQIANQRQLFDARAMQLKAEQEEMARVNAARDRFKQANPNLADAADIDFKSAFKAANPQMSDASPYGQFLDTTKGLFFGNVRDGNVRPVIAPDGTMLVKSASDPNLQTSISTGKGYGSTFGSNMADAGLSMPTFSQPKPTKAPTPAGFPSVSPNVQVQRDDKRMQILIAEQEAAGGRGKNPELDKEINNMKMRGYSAKVPTKAELDAASAGAKRQAEADVDLNMKPQITEADAQAKARVDLATDKTKNVRTADKFLSAATEAQALLEKDPTGSGVGALADSVGRAVGYSSDSSQVASQLETLSGWMVSNVPRMEGPQSNYDVENYKTMAGMVGNRTVPVAERKAALKEVIKLQEKYKSLNGGGSAPKATAKGKFSITAPNGKEYSFGSQNELNNFKMKANIR